MTFDFESGLKELATIVEQMERETLSLETLMTYFERGTFLAQSCQQALDQAEQIVQKIKVDPPENEIKVSE